MKKKLSLQGVKENNLKNLSIDIPHDALVCVTGLSGSGKSSLAFDTIYAEGQRRYIETFSPYTRQFLDKIKKPELDFVANVRPAIAIQQKTKISNSRSTVGSLTNINDYLRTLWSHVAKPTCATCGEALQSFSAPELTAVAKQLASAQPDTSFLICVTILLPKKKLAQKELFEQLATIGYSRFLDAKNMKPILVEPESPPPLWLSGQVVVAIDRFNARRFKEKSVLDSIAQAYALTAGSCALIPQSEFQKHSNAFPLEAFTYFQQLRCRKHSETFVPRLRKSLFSYNHPNGACSSCNGFGFMLTIDPDRCVPNPGLSIKEHALHCWSSESRSREFSRLLTFCKKQKIPVSKPWYTLSKAQQEKIFEAKEKNYTGVLHWFKRLERKSYRMHVRVFLSKYRAQTTCPGCNGSRLKPEALLYKHADMSLPALWELQIDALADWVNRCYEELSAAGDFPRALQDLFESTLDRLRFLLDLGLSYLTLSRQARTLSGGETQRVNLAAALGSNLTSTHFVLDEPSVGLHSRDTERLVHAVRKLCAGQNSVLVVEHDPAFIQSADTVIEIGPGAGSAGGEIVYNGSYEKWSNKDTLSLPDPATKPLSKRKKSIRIKKARARNLKNISCSIPLESLTVLSGVSGSGKSTLVSEVLLEAYRCYAQGIPDSLVAGSVSGFEHIADCAYIDQSPLAKSPRANVATYSKIWDHLRSLLADTDLATQRALTRSSFSFNVDKGRCVSCSGAGYVKEDMQFLSDVYLLCEDCLGKRFQDTILEVSYSGKNVYQWLETTINEAAVLLQEHPKIVATCNLLQEVGLGHLTLGHSLSELSGGEAQRLKVIRFIDSSKQDATLLIFDEPTTGLHTQDVRLLLALFQSLKSYGHTILCIEHNLDVIAAADKVIDLGPEGGALGGEVLFEGSVSELRRSKKSHTAHYLRSPGKIAKRRKAKKVGSNEKRSTLIEGARQHNLKNISLSVPLEKIVAFTGVSGSGKSSIAKDILFAEGQRRYLDCLSPYARQFIKGLDKPLVDSVKNIPPSVYVGQHVTLPLQLSTIATLSEIYNFLRLLFVKVGDQYCPDHPDQKISHLSAEAITRELRAGYAEPIRILAPVIIKKKGNHKEVIRRSLDAEVSELRVDGTFCSPGSVIEGLERNKVHSIDYVIAACNPARVDSEILSDAVSHALTLGSGSVIVTTTAGERVFSSSRSCPACKRGFFKPDPEDLSFNSRRGACTKCAGTGLVRGKICKDCGGDRLNRIGRSIRILDTNISELVAQPPSDVLRFLNEFKASESRLTVAASILGEVSAKLETLIALGLDHLTLSRDCRTLSGGELQRVRLAGALGSSLSGVLYLLDEPSAGLHPNDTRLVLDKITSLKQNGSSVVLIEHDPDSIAIADHVVELGPGGGKNGGSVLFSGSMSDFLSTDTKTAQAVTSSLALPIKDSPRKHDSLLTVRKGSFNTVTVSDCSIPLNVLTVFCGVSGSGKSSLVHGIIAETLSDSTSGNPLRHWKSDTASIDATTDVQKVLLIDQQPIGKNSRSTPASYLGIWNHIRTLFGHTPEAKSLGWTASYFSYNTGKGRCPACEGRSELKLEMNFLANAAITCDMCEGRRFSDEANTIRYLGCTPADTLSLTFEEAKTHFANHPKIRKPLDRACALGLGYLTLGQSSATLSGGEAQRLKLVAELNTRQSAHTLYILDEPTTGLHVDDVSKLLHVLSELVDLGNSVFVIEHDPVVIAAADHIVELGPGPGQAGGNIIYQGTAKNLAGKPTPWGIILGNTERTLQQRAV